MNQGIMFKRKKDLLHVCFSGDIDSYNVSQYRHTLNLELQHPYQTIIFDFEKVKFMDSSAIGLVLGRYNLVKSKSKIYLCHMNEVAYRMFELTGIFSLMPYISNVEEIYSKAGGKHE